MYLITGSSGVYIVDPSVSPKMAEEYSGIDGLATGDAKVKALFLTHGHHDHIKYINEWIEAYPLVNVFFSSNDNDLVKNGFMNCSYMEGMEVSYNFKYSNIAGTNGWKAYTDDDISFTVYETPGHTMGSVCFLVEFGGKKVLFTGDTVFRGSVGRTDMPGGSSKTLMESIKRISKLDPSLVIYPGHGPESDIDKEIRFNPFFSL
ncbi:glyoxylase-like metal-dependent hydrolase (beta-lactamase superfamily II) [Ruminococcaceae bacterium R-25]|nr:glyoxylase-like metal-dependent hydrolase (beta-lactamase superfamily II) [Ruminococcaceae bacterium R-25]SUQ11449.1 Glyoxylase, beta-lactamase superfamily II [Oscillospiraceae bacterium]